ncbi:MAG: hypothetical protein WAT66_03545 [Actinomycetota bacterium]
MADASEERRDAVDYMLPFVREADQQADLVIVVLQALGVPPGTPLAPDLLLKLAAFVRIYQWEQTGLRALLAVDLPTARDVFDDIWGTPQQSAPRYSGKKLANAVLWIAARQLAGRPVDANHPNIAVSQQLPPDQMLDLVARFLWQLRHLANPKE